MSDVPWSDEAVPMPDVSAEVEAWARALVIADGEKPDKVIGFPALPRWCSYIRYAELCLRAKAIVEASA
jgi:hypothetical protein